MQRTTGPRGKNLLSGLTQLHPDDTTGSRRRDSYQHRLPGRRKRRRLGPVKNCEFARVHFSGTDEAGEPVQRVASGKRSPLAISVSGPRRTRSPTAVS